MTDGRHLEKIEKSRYPRNGLTEINFGMVMHLGPRIPCSKYNFRTLKKSKMANGRHLENRKNHDIIEIV